MRGENPGGGGGGAGCCSKNNNLGGGGGVLCCCSRRTERGKQAGRGGGGPETTTPPHSKWYAGTPRLWVVDALAGGAPPPLGCQKASLPGPSRKATPIPAQEIPSTQFLGRNPRAPLGPSIRFLLLQGAPSLLVYKLAICFRTWIRDAVAVQVQDL